MSSSKTKLKAFTVEVLAAHEMTEEHLRTASHLFSTNYAVWGTSAPPPLNPGSRVRLSAKQLRRQGVFRQQPAYCMARIMVPSTGACAGHAFGCHYQSPAGRVLWITQLIVAETWRQQGLATTLIRSLRDDEDEIFGIASSHAGAIAAAARALGNGIEHVDLDIASERKSVVESCPVEYIRQAAVSEHDWLINTNFPVCHVEPTAALEQLRSSGVEWPFGELKEGHEFLFVNRIRRVAARRRT